MVGCGNFSSMAKPRCAPQSGPRVGLPSPSTSLSTAASGQHGVAGSTRRAEDSGSVPEGIQRGSPASTAATGPLPNEGAPKQQVTCASCRSPVQAISAAFLLPAESHAESGSVPTPGGDLGYADRVASWGDFSEEVSWGNEGGDSDPRAPHRQPEGRRWPVEAGLQAGTETRAQAVYSALMRNVFLSRKAEQAAEPRSPSSPP